MSDMAPLWSFAELVSDSAQPDGFQVSLEDIVSHTGRLVEGELSSYTAKGTPFVEGDVLFGKLRPYLAKYWLADRSGTAGGDIHVYRPAEKAEPRFLQYIVGSENFIEFADASSKGTKMPRAEWTSLREFPAPQHDLQTQRRIADYLDRETSQIDAMIDKLGELDEALRSRHSANVTKAVIGDGSELTRRTGDTWIPEIPSHWNLGTVRLVAKRVTDGSHVSPETENGAYDFVSTRDITNGVIDFEGSLKTSESSYEELVRGGCQPFDGDLLYSKDGTIGETAIVRGAHDFVVASSLIIVTPDPEIIDVRYLNHVLMSEPTQEAARSYSRGAGLPRLSIWNFSRGVPIPVPPLAEQRRIADHLDDVTSKIDAMLSKVAQLKDLLTERRAALITDVVTGRKDVA